MARAGRLALAATVLFAGGASSLSHPGMGLFSVSVPREMVTGPVLIRARTEDESIRTVRWTVDDWSRNTPAPFELAFDAGPVPYERRVLAVALDKDRRPLYRREAILNPGGRRLELEFRRPVDGQRTFGAVPVELHVRTPADDELATLELEADGTAVALAPASPRTWVGEAHLPPREAAFVARLQTRRGRELDRTVLVNTPGFVASADVHVVDLLVGVSRGGRSVEGLGKDDFSVRDDRGTCTVRDARLLRDAPLAIGFAIDTSISLRHTPELRRAAVEVFVERCFAPNDSAFVLTFGPAVRMSLDWSHSKERLRETILALEDYQVSGTALFEAIQRSLYQLQGSRGARALILVTDGYDYEGDVTEEAALAYARQSGIQIYAIGLTSTGTDGERAVVLPPNERVLEQLAAETGGRVFLVTDAKDLPDIFRAIERDLRAQYLVSFVSAARRTGTFHPLEVKSRKGRVRTAGGYFY
ncbi:MAG: VWA domain-containing protein [Deltaproteobacteria bacterium]|nr:VWA domain-containing protein [Deltaproteobacteria bacterium]